MNLRNSILSQDTWKYLTVVLFFLSLNFSQAQKIQFMQGMAQYQGEEQASIIARVEPGTKDIKGALKDWMQEEFDVKLKGFGFLTNKSTLSAEGVIIPTLSDKRLDFFAKVTKDGDKSKIQFFSAFGPEVPITPTTYPATYAALQTLTLDFLDYYLPQWYRSRIAEAQEVVGDLRKEREDLIKDRQDNQAEIQELREEVLDIEQEITNTSEDLNTAEDKLSNELSALHTVGHQLKNSRSSLSYIVVLDRSYFPSLKITEVDSNPNTRRSPADTQMYEERVKNHLYSFAKDELDLKAKQVTQIYSGTLLGFAVEIEETEKDQFFKKAQQLKAIERVEKDQKAGIF